MKPEQLVKGISLTKTIENLEIPFTLIEDGERAKYWNAVTFTCTNNSTNNVTFRLNIEQRKIVKTLIESMAKQNLEELKKEFKEL